MRGRRSIPALMGAIAWATASLVGCVCLAGSATASPPPAVHLSTQFAEIGQLLLISGTGWSPVGQTVQIELCGQNARDLSSDCDQNNQATVAIRAGGVFAGGLPVRLPPSPCPCVVAVAAQTGLAAVDVPITILGAPNVPIPPPTAPVAPVALSANILTPVSVSSWFGGPKTVTLVLRVTNKSLIAYGTPTLTVNVGRGPNPSSFVLGRTLAPLAVGATQVLRIPVTLPAFTAGHYSVRAQVITGQGQVATVVSTRSYPWGLFVVGVIVLLIAGRAIWKRQRRLRKGRQPPLPPPPPPPPPPSGNGLEGSETAPEPQEPLVKAGRRWSW